MKKKPKNWLSAVSALLVFCLVLSGSYLLYAGAEETDLITIEAVDVPQVQIAVLGSNIPAKLTGKNFTEGMTLTVGAKEVSYTLLSDTELKFYIPQNNMGPADITITCGEQTVTLENAILYNDSESMARFSYSAAVYAEDEIRIPLTVASRGNIHSVSMQIKYDPAYLGDFSFEVSTMNTKATAGVSITEEGVAELTIESEEAALLSGVPVGYLVARVKPLTEAASTKITVPSASFNGAQTIGLGCILNILPYHSISGKITHSHTGVALAGVKVVLSTGQETLTDENGNYFFPRVCATSVTVTAVLPGSFSEEITAYDASLILQGGLSEQQTLVADMNGDGVANIMDAMILLKLAAGQEVTGINTGWIFSRQSIQLVLTEADASVDFDAYLMGDVSGSFSSRLGA